MIHKDVSKTICSKSLLPDCKPSGEMLALQSLVNAFADSIRASQNHMQGLSDEIESHKKHIARLKDELSAACRRQLSAPVVPPPTEVSIDYYPTGREFSMEFKFRYFANGKFTEFKSRLLLNFYKSLNDSLDD